MLYIGDEFVTIFEDNVIIWTGRLSLKNSFFYLNT